MEIVLGMFQGEIMRSPQTSESAVPGGYFGYEDFHIDLIIHELETVFLVAKCFSFAPYHTAPTY